MVIDSDYHYTDFRRIFEVTVGYQAGALAVFDEVATEVAEAFGLLRLQADELESMKKSHAMPHHGTEFHGFAIRERQLHRYDLSSHEFGGSDGAQTQLGDLSAASMDAKVTILPEHANDQRQVSAEAWDTALVAAAIFLTRALGRRGGHSFNHNQCDGFCLWCKGYAGHLQNAAVFPREHCGKLA
jgi:hypothetical protein